MKSLIKIENITKEFWIGYRKNGSIIDKLLYSFSGRDKQKKLFALNDVSFDLIEGENIGLIGRNGTGKSTLLKIIAGIYIPTKGNITIKGKVFYISGYNLGLNPKLTARENIYFIGTLYGLSRQEISNLFDQIIDFSKLGDFLDTKVYHFSSGMKTRLSFTASIFFIIFNNPKIILMDEVFSAAADEEFNNRAFKKTEELLNNGTTIILATHNMNLIKKYCKKVIFLEAGKIFSNGEPEKVIQDYLKFIKEVNDSNNKL